MNAAAAATSAFLQGVEPVGQDRLVLVTPAAFRRLLAKHLRRNESPSTKNPSGSRRAGSEVM